MQRHSTVSNLSVNIHINYLLVPCRDTLNAVTYVVLNAASCRAVLEWKVERNFRRPTEHWCLAALSNHV